MNKNTTYSILITILNRLQKGGVPAAPSGTATLLRLSPNHRFHVPPLVRAPVNSFEFHRCRRTPQVGYLSLSLGDRLYIADREYPSFTVWTTRVSNPV